VPHMAQKKPKLAHVMSCGWWKGGGGRVVVAFHLKERKTYNKDI